MSGNATYRDLADAAGPTRGLLAGDVEPSDFATIKAVAVWLPLVVPYKNNG
jgi:hypothetical protein